MRELVYWRLTVLIVRPRALTWALQKKYIYQYFPCRVSRTSSSKAPHGHCDATREVRFRFWEYLERAMEQKYMATQTTKHATISGILPMALHNAKYGLVATVHAVFEWFTSWQLMDSALLTDSACHTKTLPRAASYMHGYQGAGLKSTPPRGTASRATRRTRKPTQTHVKA